MNPGGKSFLYRSEYFLKAGTTHTSILTVRLNPALLILPLFSFFVSERDSDLTRGKNEKMIFAGFSILFILIVFFRTNMRIRYIAPAIPCLVILSIYGMKNIFLIIDRHIAERAGNVITGLSVATVSDLFQFKRGLHRRSVSNCHAVSISER